MSRSVMVGLGALAIMLTSCRLDTIVTVTVARDGTGTVRIEAVADEELVERATQFAGAHPIESFRTGDLENSGWMVERDVAGRRLVLTRPFRSVEEVALLVAGLEPGVTSPVLSDFRVGRRQGLFSGSYTFRGTVDLRNGGLSEPLAELLQGLDPTVVEPIAGGDLDAALFVELSVRIPGGGGSSSWKVEPGQRVEAAAETSERNWLAIVAAIGVGLLVVVTLLLSIAVGLAARQRHRP